MKHALAVLTGIAVGMPVMAALASVSGHAAGGLPDRYVPWARAGHRIQSGFATLRAPVQQHHAHRVTARQHAREPVSAPRETFFQTPRPEPTDRPDLRPAQADRVPGLRVSIAAPRSVRAGGTYEYRIRLANHGPGMSRAITVRNLLPKGVVRTSSTLPDGVGGYAGGRDATLVMPRLAAGRSATARFEVRVRPKVRGDLVAHSRIAHVGGVRAHRPDDYTSQVSTHIR